MITKEEVKRIASLARLGISEAEEEKFQKEISSILDYFKSLQELDVSKVQPLYHPGENFMEESGIMRSDKEEAFSGDLAKKLVEAAPDKQKEYVKVKAIFH